MSLIDSHQCLPQIQWCERGVDDDVKTRLTYSSREESGVDDVLKVVGQPGSGSGGTCTR